MSTKTTDVTALKNLLPVRPKTTLGITKKRMAFAKLFALHTSAIRFYTAGCFVGEW